MSERRTAWLALMFAALCTYYVAVEGVRLRPAIPEWQRAEKILTCPEAGLDEITVRTAAGAISGKRGPAGWTTAAGGFAPGAFGDLADALCTLPVIDRVAEVSSLADFGLEKPRSEVEVKAGEETHRLAIGDTTPARNLLYLRIDERL